MLDKRLNQPDKAFHIAFSPVVENDQRKKKIQHQYKNKSQQLKKQEQKVVLENGQYFKYKLRVENHNESSAVFVRLQTEVDGICDPKRITWRDSNKLER